MSLLLLLCVALCGGFRMHTGTVTRRSMRSRLGHAFVRCAEDGESPGLLKGLFTTNRDTPEAMANQIEWAREQMALEVPDATVDGSTIADREVRAPCGRAKMPMLLHVAASAARP